MPKGSFSYKSTTSGCCKKCGKPMQWRPASMISIENTTSCMVTAESHIQELQRDVAKNTLYCSDCRDKIKDDLILNIILFPFRILKSMFKVFSR